MYKTKKIIHKKERHISIIHQWTIPKPLGVIQLIHGSLEHCKRYDNLAKVFNQAGFNVIGNDHRGHGLTAKTNQAQIGHVGKNQNAQNIINDLLIVNQLIKQEYPKIPIILFGHSWGSYLARACMGKTQFNYQGAIISGTGWERKCKLNLALLFLRIVQFFKGNNDARSFKMMHHISFSAFNKKFVKKSQTKLEWCTGDKKEQLKFFQDPLRGKMFSIAGFRALVGATKIACSNKTIRETNSQVPLLIVSGKLDPVGLMGKGVNKFVTKLLKEKFLNVTKILYSNQRHEIHLDTNKEQYFADLRKWLSKVAPQIK